MAQEKPPYVLHISRPALSLPTIDPDSLAALTYLTSRLPPEQFSILSHYDASLSPSRSVPLLQNADSQAVGLSSIFTSLKSNQNPKAQAASLALATHLQSSLAPSISYHLYGSRANYAHHTRPEFSRTAPSVFHAYTLAPNLHEFHSQRAAEAGLYGADPGWNPASSNTSGQSAQGAQTLEDAIRAGEERSTSESLIFRRQSRLKALVRERNARARLSQAVDTVMRDALQPVRATLKRDGEVSDEVQAVLVGYLGVILWAAQGKMEDRIVEECLREKWQDVLNIVEGARDSLRVEVLRDSGVLDKQALTGFGEHLSVLVQAMMPEKMAHSLILGRIDGFSNIHMTAFATTGLAICGGLAWGCWMVKRGFGFGAAKIVFGRRPNPWQQMSDFNTALGGLFRT